MFSGIKCFSVRPLRSMVKFVREVDDQFCNSYCRIPWDHNVMLQDINQPIGVSGYRLVDIIQNRLKEMSNWTEKPETRAEVDILIRDELWMKMPESVSDEALMVYRGEIFDCFYTRFAA